MQSASKSSRFEYGTTDFWMDALGLRQQRQSGGQGAESERKQLPDDVRAILGPLRRELINYCDAEGA